MNNIEGNILKDVIVCMTGIAKGHEFEINDKFIKDLAKDGNKSGTIKTRINHPGDRGNVLSIVGEASDFYLSTCKDKDGIEHKCVKVKKIKIFDLPDDSGNKIIALAKQANQHFGMSIDALIKFGKKSTAGVKTAIFEKLNSIDFVDQPAATPALFSTMVGCNNVQLSTKVVINDNIVEKELIKENLKMEKQSIKLEEEAKKVEEVTPATPDKKDEKDIHQVLEEMVKRMEELSKRIQSLEEAEEEEVKKQEESESKVKAEEEEDESKKPEADKAEEAEAEEEEESKKLEAKIAELATKQVTALLASTGAKITKSEKQAPVERQDEAGLTPEQKQLAAKLEIDENLFIKNLEAAKRYNS